MATAAGVEIVGRDEELASLVSFLDAPESGRALVVEGEAGIGKTTLWRAAVATAESSDYVVLSCSPGLSERELAFAALGDLLEPVLEEVLPELPVPQRRALEVALLREDSSSSSAVGRFSSASTTAAPGTQSSSTRSCSRRN